MRKPHGSPKHDFEGPRKAGARGTVSARLTLPCEAIRLRPAPTTITITPAQRPLSN